MTGYAQPFCKPWCISPTGWATSPLPLAAYVFADRARFLVRPRAETHLVTRNRRISRQEAPRKKAFDKRDSDFERLFVVIGTQLSLDVVDNHPERDPISVSEADEPIENLCGIHANSNAERCVRVDADAREASLFEMLWRDYSGIDRTPP
jgi:hypothetical protein